MDLVRIVKEAQKAAKAKRYCPMRRLLETATRTGMAEVDSASHWQTVFKAQRLGLIDADQALTEEGRAWLAKDRERLP